MCRDAALVERHAAAHRDCLAGHIGIADQHHCGDRDLFRSAEAAEGYPAGEIVLTLHHVRFDQGRRNRIDRDAFLDKSRRVAARQSLHTGLGGIVVRADRARAARRTGGDVDNASPLPSAHQR